MYGCTRACDNRGAHLTTCATGGGAVIIHDTVNDALANFGFRQVYPPNLVLSKRPEIREHLLQKFGLARDAQLPFPTPDVMTLGEETLYVDTRITDPRGDSNMAQGAAAADGAGAGAAAEAAAAQKLADYRQAFEGNFMRETQFAPFVMEHGGRLSKSADKILRRLAALHEAKLLNLPPSNKLGPVGNRFLTMIRQIMSATLRTRLRAAASSRCLIASSSRRPRAPVTGESSVSLTRSLSPRP